MRSSFQTKGFDKLEKTLAKLAVGLTEDKLLSALLGGGEIVAEEARRLVPVDTGLLRDSIKVLPGTAARLDRPVSSSGGVSVDVGPVGSTEDGDVFYAKFIEFGTAYQPAQPFMRPALANKQEAAARLIVSRLRVAVVEAAR